MASAESPESFLSEGVEWFWIGDEMIEPGDPFQVEIFTEKSEHLEFEGDTFFNVESMTSYTSGCRSDFQCFNQNPEKRCWHVTLVPPCWMSRNDIKAHLLTQPVFLVKKDNSPTRNFRLAWDFWRFSRSIFERGTSDFNCNILLFGIGGSGKSSFINSLLTTLSSDRRTLSIAVTGTKSDHVTTKFLPYRVGRIQNGELKQPTCFRILDTWGLTRNNYKQDEFLKILKGELPPGFEMGQTPQTCELSEADKLDREAHAVIFFIPIGECANQNSPLVQETKKYFDLAQENGAFPVVALSMADVLYPEFPKNREIYPQKEIDHLSNIFGFSSEFIYPIVNMTGRTRNFDCESRIFELFELAASRAVAKVLVQLAMNYTY